VPTIFNDIQYMPGKVAVGAFEWSFRSLEKGFGKRGFLTVFVQHTKVS
jgi:hypothetical protein